MRSKIKYFIYGILYVLIFPVGRVTRWICKFLKWNALFNFWAEIFAFIPGPLGLLSRSCFYNQVLEKAHYSLLVRFGGIFTTMDSEVGKNVRIGRYTTVGLVKMGDNSSISGHCALLSGANTHNFEDPSEPVFNGIEFFTKIKIGENSFVGESSVIMANVGDYTIVGSGSVVVKEIPDYVIAVGNPAIAVKHRNRDRIGVNANQNQ